MAFVNNACSRLAASFALNRAREATGLALAVAVDEVMTLAGELAARGDAHSTQDGIASALAALAEGEALRAHGACGDARHAAWRAAWRAMGEEV